VEIRNATDSIFDEKKEDEKLMFLQYRGNVYDGTIIGRSQGDHFA